MIMYEVLSPSCRALWPKKVFITIMNDVSWRRHFVRWWSKIRVLTRVAKILALRLIKGLNNNADNNMIYDGLFYKQLTNPSIKSKLIQFLTLFLVGARIWHKSPIPRSLRSTSGRLQSQRTTRHSYPCLSKNGIKHR